MSREAAPESSFDRWVIGVLSAAVCVIVALVVYAFPGRTVGHTPGMLPTVNAVLNAAATVFLTLGYAFIRRGKVKAHRACMITTLVISLGFLVTYLLHHAQVGSVPFEGQGSVRIIYFALLIPHIILAAVLVPFALLTVFRAFRGSFSAHRRVARITLPIWLFVSVSGVLVYAMLYHLPV
jgi:uncharacterized membrane protein YozB (DUF420 family)